MAPQGARKKLNFGHDETPSQRVDYHSVPLDTLKELYVSATKQAEAMDTTFKKMRKDFQPDELREFDPRDEPSTSSIYPHLPANDDTLGGNSTRGELRDLLQPP